jgi:nitroreductase
MNVKDAIDTRRAYRSLEPIEITDDIVTDLARSAILAPSCFNNQPTRFVFVYEPAMLEKLKDTLSRGNVWAKAASMIIAVFGKEDSDCMIKDRIYYLFDLGQAAAFLQLRATELGLVAHPIAGYNPDKVKEILSIPKEMTVITLIIVGKKSDAISPVLSEEQVTKEKARPERLALDEFAFRNVYSAKDSPSREK